MLFAEPIANHIEELFRCADALLGDRNRAEAAVRDTCVRAEECLAESSVLPEGRSWIFGLLLEEVRRRHCPRLFGFGLFSRGSDDEILSGLRRLSVEQSEVIVLVDVQGFTYREAAEALGISREGVIERLVQARRELRALLRVDERRIIRASAAGRSAGVIA